LGKNNCRRQYVKYSNTKTYVVIFGIPVGSRNLGVLNYIRVKPRVADTILWKTAWIVL